MRKINPSWYEKHILPYLIDLVCGMKPISRQREKLIPLAQGRILEIGIGTGLNIPYYNQSKVEKITGLDPGLQMHSLAIKRMKRAKISIELIGLSAEKIPLPDASFHSIVVTYSLCTIPEPLAALKEMHRLLAPKGKLLFCEHGRSPDEAVYRWQNRLNHFWKKIAGGCHLNRDIPALLKEARFECEKIETQYLPGPRPLSYHYWGEAIAI